MATSWWIFLIIHVLGTGVILSRLGENKGRYGFNDVISCIIVFALLLGIYMGW